MKCLDGRATVYPAHHRRLNDSGTEGGSAGVRAQTLSSEALTLTTAASTTAALRTGAPGCGPNPNFGNPNPRPCALTQAAPGARPRRRRSL